MVASRCLHKANSVRWLRLSFNRWAKQHGSDFREQRRRLAIPKLARIIRDAGRSHAERQHAIETFGLVINQRFSSRPRPDECDGCVACSGWFAMSPWKAYLEDIIFSFRKHKELAEKAFRQVEDQGFFQKPGEHSNSIALVIKHVAGNLASRWTDFLTTDGDKPWRDRDAEFVIRPEDTRERLLAAWEAGWSALFQTLADLQEADLLKKVTIPRQEPPA